MVGVLQSYDPMGPVLIGREELSPRDESRSGTEASIVTVATLSYDLLEELSQNQYNLECPQLMDATNESDNEISQLVFQEDAVPQSSDFSRSIFVSPTIDNLSNDAAILHPTISLHDALPGLDRPQGPSTISPQSVSRTDTPLLSIEPENQPSSCVIRRLVTVLSTGYRITEWHRPCQALLQPNQPQASQFYLFMRAAQARNLRR